MKKLLYGMMLSSAIGSAHYIRASWISVGSTGNITYPAHRGFSMGDYAETTEKKEAQPEIESKDLAIFKQKIADLYAAKLKQGNKDPHAFEQQINDLYWAELKKAANKEITSSVLADMTYLLRKVPFEQRSFTAVKVALSKTLSQNKNKALQKLASYLRNSFNTALQHDDLDAIKELMSSMSPTAVEESFDDVIPKLRFTQKTVDILDFVLRKVKIAPIVINNTVALIKFNNPAGGPYVDKAIAEINIYRRPY